MNTDGNLAALRTYERQQDAIAEGDAHLESLQQALADDLFDAYLSNNFAVIDEVDDALRGVDTLDNMLKQLRDSWTRDGMALRAAYMKVIGAVCEDIAKGRTTPDEFDRFRREFDL